MCFFVLSSHPHIKCYLTCLWHHYFYLCLILRQYCCNYIHTYTNTYIKTYIQILSSSQHFISLHSTIQTMNICLSVCLSVCRSICRTDGRKDGRIDRWMDGLTINRIIRKVPDIVPTSPLPPFIHTSLPSSLPSSIPPSLRSFRLITLLFLIASMHCTPSILNILMPNASHNSYLINVISLFCFPDYSFIALHCIALYCVELYLFHSFIPYFIRNTCYTYQKFFFSLKKFDA